MVGTRAVVRADEMAELTGTLLVDVKADVKADELADEKVAVTVAQ